MTQPDTNASKEPQYKFVKELPEPITCMVDHRGYLIVASANKLYKAKLPDGEILYQLTFAMYDNKDGDI